MKASIKSLFLLVLLIYNCSTVSSDSSSGNQNSNVVPIVLGILGGLVFVNIVIGLVSVAIQDEIIIKQNQLNMEYKTTLEQEFETQATNKVLELTKQVIEVFKGAKTPQDIYNKIDELFKEGKLNKLLTVYQESLKHVVGEDYNKYIGDFSSLSDYNKYIKTLNFARKFLYEFEKSKNLDDALRDLGMASGDIPAIAVGDSLAQTINESVIDMLVNQRLTDYITSKNPSISIEDVASIISSEDFRNSNENFLNKLKSSIRTGYNLDPKSFFDKEYKAITQEEFSNLKQKNLGSGRDSSVDQLAIKFLNIYRSRLLEIQWTNFKSRTGFSDITKSTFGEMQITARILRALEQFTREAKIVVSELGKVYLQKGNELFEYNRTTRRLESVKDRPAELRELDPDPV
ncbi:hypothetical protein A3F66_02005 [candidate division TM6 bacterium RIFCSPHIGHO2_12_FULL_32_22]|nr:MAG: hypothetical protein A3F66_02005 [candidate division TM6 bacterium RIFCSPHIGHO2_12_FULL_32_22]